MNQIEGIITVSQKRSCVANKVMKPQREGPGISQRNVHANKPNNGNGIGRQVALIPAGRLTGPTKRTKYRHM